MKRKKTLVLLAAVLIVMCAAIVIIKAVGAHMDTVNTVDEEVMTLDLEQVTAINYTYNNIVFDFKKNGEQWEEQSDTQFPVDTDKIEELIGHFTSVHASFMIEDVTDFDQYGLKDPECTITFTEGEETKEISFGNYSTIDNKRYVTVGDGKVYMIDEDLLTYISTEVTGYVKSEGYAAYEEVNELELNGSQSIRIVKDEEDNHGYQNDFTYFQLDGGSYKALSTNQVSELISTIQKLDLSTYVQYYSDEDKLADYGLDQPTLSVRLKGKLAAEDGEEEGESVESTLYLYKKDDSTVYGRFDDSTIVYQITAESYQTLEEASYDTLRPDQIMDIIWSELKNIQVAMDGETYDISVKYKEDAPEDSTYKLGGEKIDLADAITKLQEASLKESGTNYEKGMSELTFTLETKSGKQNITFSRYDGASCVVSVDGATIGLIARSDMVDLREAFLCTILGVPEEE